MEAFGSHLKKLFASDDFREFYIESVAVEQKNLADSIKHNGEKDLWKLLRRHVLMLRRRHH
jgi:hypothetical protein